MRQESTNPAHKHIRRTDHMKYLLTFTALFPLFSLSAQKVIDEREIIDQLMLTRLQNYYERKVSQTTERYHQFIDNTTNVTEEDTKRYMEAAWEEFTRLRNAKLRELQAKENQLNRNIDLYNQLVDEIRPQVEEYKSLSELQTRLQSNLQQNEHLYRESAQILDQINSMLNPYIERYQEAAGLQETLNGIIEAYESGTHPSAQEIADIMEDFEAFKEVVVFELEAQADEYNALLAAYREWLEDMQGYLASLQSEITSLATDIQEQTEIANADIVEYNDLVDERNRCRTNSCVSSYDLELRRLNARINIQTNYVDELKVRHNNAVTNYNGQFSRIEGENTAQANTIQERRTVLEREEQEVFESLENRQQEDSEEIRAINLVLENELDDIREEIEEIESFVKEGLGENYAQGISSHREYIDAMARHMANPESFVPFLNPIGATPAVVFCSQFLKEENHTSVYESICENGYLVDQKMRTFVDIYEKLSSANRRLETLERELMAKGEKQQELEGLITTQREEFFALGESTNREIEQYLQDYQDELEALVQSSGQQTGLMAQIYLLELRIIELEYQLLQQVILDTQDDASIQEINAANNELDALPLVREGVNNKDVLGETSLAEDILATQLKSHTAVVPWRAFSGEENFSVQEMRGEEKDAFMATWYGILADAGIFQERAQNGELEPYFFEVLFREAMGNGVLLNKVSLENNEVSYQIVANGKTYWIGSDGQLFEIPFADLFEFEFRAESRIDRIIADYYQDFKSEFEPLYGNLDAGRQDAIALAEALLREAYALENEAISTRATGLAEGLGQIALGMTPVVGDAVDLYEFAFGRDIFGNSIGVTSQVAAGLGFLFFGNRQMWSSFLESSMGSTIKLTGKGLRRPPGALLREAESIANLTTREGAAFLQKVVKSVDSEVPRAKLERIARSYKALDEVMKANLGNLPPKQSWEVTRTIRQNADESLTANDVFRSNYSGYVSGEGRYAIQGNAGLHGAVDASNMRALETSRVEVDFNPNNEAGFITGTKTYEVVTLDLTNPEIRRRIGVTERNLIELTVDDSNAYELTQQIGDIAKNLGYEAIVYPSASTKGRGKAIVVLKEELF